MSKKKLTIVNRHFPPNVDITGENAWDLTKYLIDQHGIEVAVVHIDRSSQGGGKQRHSIGKTYTISTFYEGRNKVLRYLSSIFDGWRLIKKAVALDHGPIIVMTSPPLLPMWASRILGKKKKEWILWSMDLFPEAFTASGELSKNGFLYRFAYRQTYKNAPDRIIALGPMQHKAFEKKYTRSIESIILPCGVFIHQDQVQTRPEWKKYPEKIYFGYAGNLGQAHSLKFLRTVVDNIDPDKHHLMLAVYGVKSKPILQYAQGKPGVTIMKRIPRDELNFLDVHLVSLMSSWTHIAVPSKAVSSICSGSAMLFCGSKESDNWQLLQEAGWLVEDDETMEDQIGKIIDSIDKVQIEQKKCKAKKISLELKKKITESYEMIASWAR